MKKEEVQFHIRCKAGDVGRYCILPEIRGAVRRLLRGLKKRSRYPRIGNLQFIPVFWQENASASVLQASAGHLRPSPWRNFSAIGAHTFIRVGTCGGMALPVRAGDVIIATGAIRMEGTSREYAPIEFPAVPDFATTCALADAARALGKPFHTGVVQCKDSFYGQHTPETMPVEPELLYKWEAWKRLGALASEMESAALFTVAAARGVRCGAVFSALWNQEREKAGLDQDAVFDAEGAITVGVEALRRLIEADSTAR